MDLGSLSRRPRVVAAVIAGVVAALAAVALVRGTAAEEPQGGRAALQAAAAEEPAAGAAPSGSASASPSAKTAGACGRPVGQVRLEHFTTGASDSTVRTGASAAHPHLVTYGAGRMLLAWESGSSMAAQVYDSGTGKAVGARFTIGVKDHNYQAFKAYADGSAAYPAAGAGGTSIRIARVLPQG
ncbi:hypothetical protein [Dactylosporangium sp. CA-139066]|uniref:hypothetical protein n=1 Tax=Dactylosporangium sp. CA-139066 TaxID=3239930 RepID=UPI003D8C9F5A